MHEFLHNIILIGSDGGDTAYGIDASGRYIEMPFIGMADEEAVVIAEEMVTDMTPDELKLVCCIIDYYVNLQRIKKADTGNNPELEYQLRVCKNKLASLGIPSEEYEL